jgi:tetratricopeptide (TPR) repeat protein
MSPAPDVLHEARGRGQGVAPVHSGAVVLSVRMPRFARVFITLLCASACASPSPSSVSSEQLRDPKRAHELTLEALEVIDDDPTAAEELLQAAVKADAYHGPAHNDLGVLYLRQSRLYEAANEFELARKLLPGNPDPRLNLGLTLERAGLYERAFDAYNAALEVSPAHIRTIQAIARLTLRTGQKSERLLGLLEDISLRGETNEWRVWAQDQMTRLKL